MSVSPPHAAGQIGSPLLALLDLSRRARRAATPAELRFIAVNDSHALASYRQASLWFVSLGVQALSGVVQVEANVPYTLWLDKVCAHLAETRAAPARIVPDDLPPELAGEWSEWMPADGLWLPVAATPDCPDCPAGGLLLGRDLPWTDAEVALLGEWMDVWQHAWRSRFKPSPWSWRRWFERARDGLRSADGVPWWRRKATRWAALVVAILCFPVRLTILVPGELVPAHPAVIRAPLDGVVDTFHVQPNQLVKKGQPLFGFDEALLQSRLEVARQALATAEAEYRQMIQLALSDTKSKAQLALLTGKIEEKRAEALYVEDQVTRARVLAPQDGIVLFDDPSEWIGKPVSIGERIMRVAAPSDVEVEAWVPLADAIPLAERAAISLYLNASPLSPVDARLRYLAHDAMQRPDGTYAYRLRAGLDATTEHRVGLKGTAKVHGGWVAFGYWVLRRPLASVRTFIGW